MQERELVQKTWRITVCDLKVCKDTHCYTGQNIFNENNFKPDPEIKFQPVRPRDYSKSGYDKGHLAPAADMTYSVQSMENSFLMSNISPQLPGCNRGIWERLESQVRRWTIKERKIYVITGPVFQSVPLLMKKSSIPVPVAFYKILFDLTPPCKMISFIVPNQTSKRRVASFTVTVDEAERITGFDFFSGLDDATENKLEAEADFKMWEK